MRDPVAVYTAVTAEYDVLLPPPDLPGVDFIAFVDDPTIATAAGWKPRQLPTPPGELSPRMRAKEPKLLPHRTMADYYATIWVDASHRILTPNFVTEMLGCVNASGMALHRHPWRDCIYDEALASVELWKYASQPIAKQVAAYRRNGHPEHWGLWACGSIARVSGVAILDEIMEAWWLECLDWSYQDQLSLPPVLRAFDVLPGQFPHHQIFNNPWFTIRDHPEPDR